MSTLNAASRIEWELWTIAQEEREKVSRSAWLLEQPTQHDVPIARRAIGRAISFVADTFRIALDTYRHGSHTGAGHRTA
jgi:hypothetical protein